MRTRCVKEEVKTSDPCANAKTYAEKCTCQPGMMWKYHTGNFCYKCSEAKDYQEKCHCSGPENAWQYAYNLCYVKKTGELVKFNEEVKTTKRPTTTTKPDPCANAKTTREKCECQPGMMWKSTGRSGYCFKCSEAKNYYEKCRCSGPENEWNYQYYFCYVKATGNTVKF